MAHVSLDSDTERIFKNRFILDEVKTYKKCGILGHPVLLAAA